jgi:hypothetical protein
VLLVVACGGLQPVDPAQALRTAAHRSELKTVNALCSQGHRQLRGLRPGIGQRGCSPAQRSDTIYKIRQGDADPLQVVTEGAVHPPAVFPSRSPQDAAAVPNLARLFDPTKGLPADLPAATPNTSGGKSRRRRLPRWRRLRTGAGGMLSELPSSGDGRNHLDLRIRTI